MDSTYAATTSTNTNSERPGSALVNRYLDLYRAARVMTGLGMTVKVVGIILGAVIFMFWFIVGAAASSSSQSTSPFGPSPASQSAAGVVVFFVCLMIGVAVGSLVGGLFFLLGVLISAQGQLLISHADAAVHTSPFLSNEERAAAMSLPFAGRTPVAAHATAQ